MAWAEAEVTAEVKAVRQSMGRIKSLWAGMITAFVTKPKANM